ncbi:MAG TPA: hypothetical protein VJT78_06500 [Candidatus Dormibacteraeota bacterium]|nr:hypothetical protein [Candidatus Dormibacteraeota bacterium]
MAGALLSVLIGGCEPSSTAAVNASPTPRAHTLAGGCAGTVLTDAEPPKWAQDGWNHQEGSPWLVPWAFGTQKTTIAYVFADQLVAGPSPRVDGTSNKVLWEARDLPSGAGVMVEGNPYGKSQPTIGIAGGPSIVEVPTPGCWTFRLTWSAGGGHADTINLDVLPAGSLPRKG